MIIVRCGKVIVKGKKDMDLQKNGILTCKNYPTLYHGFLQKVEIPVQTAILECITPKLFSKGRLLANKCLTMYMEIHDNPPFPAWKDGLDEVWN